MKNRSITSLLAGVIGVIAVTYSPVAYSQFTSTAQRQVQLPVNVLGTGSNAWHYLIMEGESFISNTASPGIGFANVWNDAALADNYGTPILQANTLASMRGALFTQPGGTFADEATYQVLFDTPGTYYVYMRFSMFNMGDNYTNEASFYMPQDFNQDPTNWPLSTVGGHCEGRGSSAGFLYILNYQGNGSRTDQTESTNYWEGNFHWNQLFSSQFLNPATQGAPGVPFRYVVTPTMVGVPQNFTIGLGGAGLAADLFLFSTVSNLMNNYTQAQLDGLINPVTVQDPGNVVGTGTNAWSYLALEAESFQFKTNHSSSVMGFVQAKAGSGITNDYYGTPILTTNSLASKKGALFSGPTPFGTVSGNPFQDEISYQVQFAIPGTYYFYMRFTMFENGGNITTYVNEDSFFLPADFNLDPGVWPISNLGGYCEGCCAGAGFLYILDYQGEGNRSNFANESGPNLWEGIYRWNQLFSSEHLSGTQGVPGVPFSYVVTPAMVGVPQNFKIAFRETGMCPDIWLFSTEPNLMNDYTQTQLDQFFVLPTLSIRTAGASAVLSWPVNTGFILEFTSSLSSPTWTPVMAPATVVGLKNNLTVSGGAGMAFYRLRQP